LTSRWLAVAGCLVAVSALGACGSDDNKSSSSTGSSGGGGGGGSKSVKIVTSLPFDATDRQQTEDVVKGEKLALKQVNNQVGSCKISFQQLDDSTAQAGQWDPGQTSSNARKAAQDKSIVGTSESSTPVHRRSRFRSRTRPV
jgi:branched-chain amino acid transport system substrate-binding protein